MVEKTRRVKRRAVEPSLHAARAFVQSNLDEGIVCPCCGQFAKRYRRMVTSGMARALIGIYLHAGEDWVHVPSVEGLSRHGGDVAKLRFWDLLEESTEKRDDGGRAGWWRLTGDGVAFVREETEVLKYAYIFNGKVERHDGPWVSIRGALGSKFRYDELMGRPR